MNLDNLQKKVDGVNNNNKYKNKKFYFFLFPLQKQFSEIIGSEHIETSAKSGMNVDNLFLSLVDKITERKLCNTGGANEAGICKFHRKIIYYI